MRFIEVVIFRLQDARGVIELHKFFGDQKRQMYGNFEGFPLFFVHCLSW